MKTPVQNLPDGWSQCDWPFDKNYSDSLKRRGVKCYVRKVRRGKVYLLDEDHFTYTASFGANSDSSHTGCFYGCKYVTHILHAMNAIDAKVLVGQI